MYKSRSFMSSLVAATLLIVSACSISTAMADELVVVDSGVVSNVHYVLDMSVGYDAFEAIECTPVTLQVVERSYVYIADFETLQATNADAFISRSSLF